MATTEYIYICILVHTCCIASQLDIGGSIVDGEWPTLHITARERSARCRAVILERGGVCPYRMLSDDKAFKRVAKAN